MLQIGGKKKKGGKKPKNQNVIVQEVFNIDFEVISNFGFLKISPPMSVDDLDAKIKEVLEKRDKF